MNRAERKREKQGRSPFITIIRTTVINGKLKKKVTHREIIFTFSDFRTSVDYIEFYKVYLHNHT